MSLDVFDLFDHQNDQTDRRLIISTAFYLKVFYFTSIGEMYIKPICSKQSPKKLQGIVKKEKKYHFNNSKKDVINTD